MTRWARVVAVWARWTGAALLSSTVAMAQYQHRVVLLQRTDGSDDDREITTRVRAELKAAGFDVILLPVTDLDPKQAVESTGHALHPAAVLFVDRPLASAAKPAGAELWLADRMLRKTVVLRLEPATSEPAAADLTARRSHEAARVAVQAVELVKARLAELAVTREPRQPAPPESPPPPRAPPRAAQGTRPNLTAALGLLEGFQDGQRTLTPVLRLGVELPERWTGEILAIDVRGGFVGLGRTAQIEHGAGSASLRHTAIQLDAVMRFAPKQHVQPFVSLGAGVLALDVAGEAPDPYRNDSERTWSGLLTASGGLWLQPVTGIGLALEAQLMEAWSKTIVRIAGEDAAEVAAPLLLLSGGVMVKF